MIDDSRSTRVRTARSLADRDSEVAAGDRQRLPGGNWQTRNLAAGLLVLAGFIAVPILFAMVFVRLSGMHF